MSLKCKEKLRLKTKSTKTFKYEQISTDRNLLNHKLYHVEESRTSELHFRPELNTNKIWVKVSKVIKLFLHINTLLNNSLTLYMFGPKVES